MMILMMVIVMAETFRDVFMFVAALICHMYTHLW